MAPDEPPPGPQASVWLLIEPAPQLGHRLSAAAYSSPQDAEAARRASPHTMLLWRIPLDPPPKRT